MLFDNDIYMGGVIFANEDSKKAFKGSSYGGRKDSLSVALNFFDLKDLGVISKYAKYVEYIKGDNYVDIIYFIDNGTKIEYKKVHIPKGLLSEELKSFVSKEMIKILGIKNIKIISHKDNKPSSEVIDKCLALLGNDINICNATYCYIDNKLHIFIISEDRDRNLFLFSVDDLK